MKPYTGSDAKEVQRGGIYYPNDMKCRAAVEKADKALKMAASDRLDLVVAVVSSAEEEDDEEESMETDQSVEGKFINLTSGISKGYALRRNYLI